MKLPFLLIFTFFLCDLSAQLEFYDCPKEKKYEYVLNAKLFPKYLLGQDSISFNWKIDTGNAFVLKYQHNYDCSGTGHLGVFASFVWAIPLTLTKFEILLDKTDSLQTPFLYMTGCGPPCTKYNFEMTHAKGVIRGELVNNIWQVKGSIEMVLLSKSLNVSISKDLIVDGSYVLWKQKGKNRNGYKFNGF